MKKLSRKQKKVLIIVIAVVAAGLAAAYFLGLFGDKEKEPETPPQPIYGQLTGVEVEKDVAKRPVLGVMIENHPDARPQTGLDSAGIVFETVAEGGITRYLALFQENMPKELGSIRSVRAYYLDWAMGFDASIAHVGGSSDALDLMDSRKAKTLSQFKYPEPYYRVKTRQAPHNMFATTDALRSLQKELGHESSKFDEIPRSSDSPLQPPTATNISIDFSAPQYAVEFRYQQADNTYVRYLAGKPDVDAATNQPITVKNVIVIKMLTPSINAVGKGEASVFKDGGVQSARWELANYRDRLKVTDNQGAEIPLNRGDTWIIALPSTGTMAH